MNYLDNNELTKQIKISKEKGEVVIELHNSFEKIFKNLAPHYHLGIFIDDIKQEVIIHLYENYKTFDTEKGKAFSYITQLIKNRILNEMRKLKMVDQNFKRIDYLTINYESFDNKLNLE